MLFSTSIEMVSACLSQILWRNKLGLVVLWWSSGYFLFGGPDFKRYFGVVETRYCLALGSVLGAWGSSVSLSKSFHVLVRCYVFFFDGFRLSFYLFYVWLWIWCRFGNFAVGLRNDDQLVYCCGGRVRCIWALFIKSFIECGLRFFCVVSSIFGIQWGR